MINKGIIQNNKKKIIMCNKYYLIRRDLKKQQKIAMYQNDIETAFAISQKLDMLPKNSSPTRVRNRCEITGRARGLVCYKLFRICGIKLREHANSGHIPGVYKI